MVSFLYRTSRLCIVGVQGALKNAQKFEIVLLACVYSALLKANQKSLQLNHFTFSSQKTSSANHHFTVPCVFSHHFLSFEMPWIVEFSIVISSFFHRVSRSSVPGVIGHNLIAPAMEDRGHPRGRWVIGGFLLKILRTNRYSNNSKQLLTLKQLSTKWWFRKYPLCYSCYGACTMWILNISDLWCNMWMLWRYRSREVSQLPKNGGQLCLLLSHSNVFALLWNHDLIQQQVIFTQLKAYSNKKEISFPFLCKVAEIFEKWMV